MIRVYGAGKMGGRMGADVLQERLEARLLCESHDIWFVDPAQGEGVSPDKEVDLSMDYATMKAYVSKDEFAIRSCDVLLVLTGDTPSEGTGIEIGLALSLGMPVVMVAPKRVSGTLMGFWSIKADALFNTTDEAVQFIAETYGGIR